MRIALILTVLALSVALVIPLARDRRSGGTFIGAIVTGDGIVVASDSRTTFLNESDKPMGYLDGMKKIYAGSGGAVAVSGLTSLGGELFDSFMDRSAFLLDRAPNEVLFGFSVWLPFKNSTNVMLISAGYVDGKPTICSRAVVQPQACQDNGFIGSRASPEIANWLGIRRSIAPKSKEAAAELEKAIDEIAAADKTVGGPVSIIQLKPSAPPQWLKNPPVDRGWKTVCDIEKDYRAGRIEFGITSSKEELERYLNSSCVQQESLNRTSR